MKRTLAEFARLAGGRLEGADRDFTGVSSDSRALVPGDLFVALRGPRFDGNEFVEAARAAGASAALVDKPAVSPLPQIVVDDTLAALTRAARLWRRAYRGTVVAVAGSNGKTTVKEMIAAILGQTGPTLATRGNLNNHIGVPLTLMRLDPAQAFAVIEIGANHSGEVAELTRLVEPDVGIVTNAGAEHLEGFGSLEGVARAEGELFAELRPEALAVINVDDAFAGLWNDLSRARRCGFGTAAAADVRAEAVRTEIDDAGFLTRFALIAPPGRTEIGLRLAGMHNVVNATGAAAAALGAGATLDQVRAGLAAVRAVAGRLQLKRAGGGARIIDDTYNANPTSMQAGIDVLASLSGRRWVVMGDMGELGRFAESSHADVGRYARERGIDRLFGTGPLTALAVDAFGRGAEWYPDVDALSAALARQLGADVTLLVKASRSSRLERVVQALVGEGGPDGLRKAG